jgi:hypothetical protein
MAPISTLRAPHEMQIHRQPPRSSSQNAIGGATAMAATLDSPQ